MSSSAMVMQSILFMTCVYTVSGQHAHGKLQDGTHVQTPRVHTIALDNVDEVFSTRIASETDICTGHPVFTTDRLDFFP